jgi:hypothetical protein
MSIQGVFQGHLCPRGKRGAELTHTILKLDVQVDGQMPDQNPNGSAGYPNRNGSWKDGTNWKQPLDGCAQCGSPSSGFVQEYQHTIFRIHTNQPRLSS